MQDQLGDRLRVFAGQHQDITGRLRHLGDILETEGMDQRAKELVDSLGIRLETHFKDEEASVYKAVDVQTKKNSPISGMVSDHRRMRQLLKRVGYPTKPSISPGTAKLELREAKSALESLAALFQAHVAKEEKVLFWLATAMETF